MQCLHCQRIIDDDSRFCTYCGQTVTTPTPVAPVEPMAPVAPVAAPAPATPVTPPAPTTSVATAPAPVTPAYTAPFVPQAAPVPTASRKGAAFCHHCGIPLSAKNARCTRCGWKSTGSLFIWLAGLICVLFLASLTLNAVLFLNHEELQDTHSQLTDDYDDTVDELNDLKTEHSEQQTHLDFYDTYAVIITENSKLYHRHGCENLDTQTFWIYNLSAAQQEGYTPCPACHD